jgi:folate-dependent phosphoribosylglycinamide formyltransferase PurN
MKNFNLAVLASGSGTNLQAMIDAIKKKKLKAFI